MTQPIRLLSASLMLTALLVTGCDTGDYRGTWRCTTTIRSEGLFSRAEVQEVTLTLKDDGRGRLQWLSDGTEHDSVSGPWHKEGRLITIDRGNGGFTALKVLSLTPQRLTMINRGGIVLEFVRVE